MFERFTKDARMIVVDAQVVARDRGDGFIGSEHLLLALAGAPGPTATALGSHGLDVSYLRSLLARSGRGEYLDADALHTVGIDLDEVRQRVEDSFGPRALDEDPGPRKRRWPLRRRKGTDGFIPFTADAKESLEQSLQVALRLGHREINSAHLALGILACGSGAGGRLLAQAADSRLRASLEHAARPAA